MSTVLDRRQATLERAASEPLDVVVIGGGINGVGVLLDAVARGMRAVLLERGDLAEGTSSRSSKLIHGGLRYLEQHQFKLVHEALRERSLLMRLAPHLVRLERFLVPVTGSWWETPYIGAGLTLYDMLGGRRGGPFRHEPKTELRRRSPALRTNGVRSGFTYSDGVTDDARYVVAVARTAERLGGTVLTRAEVVDFAWSRGAVAAVSVRDVIAGDVHHIRARAVVDATGAFEVEQPLLATGGHLIPSRGSHLVLRRSALPGDHGLTIRVPGRVVFFVPWLGFWLLGTTDVPHVGPVRDARPTADEVAYLLEVADEVLDVTIERQDIVGGFAGVRPLVAATSSDGGGTEDVSREHQIIERAPGLFSVRGGKYTTYRRIAAETVDRVAVHLGRSGPSVTDQIPLVGSAPLRVLERVEADLVRDGIDADVAASLVRRHGIEAREIAWLATRLALDGRLVPTLPYLTAETWWAVLHEHALTIDDVLARRTRAAIQDADQARGAAPAVADVLAELLDLAPLARQQAIADHSSAASQYEVPVASGLIEQEVVAS